uniref:histone deacetylase family protein n=1 Tax=Fulvivirga sp. TaxID=1931237 RepID=UPI00404B868D
MIKFAFSNKYIYPLPDGHRFPIEKYELVKEQLIYEGTIHEEQVYDPGLVDEKLILDVHTEEYWHSLRDLTIGVRAAKKIGLPVNEMSVNRARNSVAGTVSSALLAKERNIAINLSGGTHHAYASHGEGFCFLNDLAIAASYLLNSKIAHQILIIDLDVHQGNGTAKIFENDKRVFTFSMHGKANYPLHKEKSDLDIALPTGINDDDYLSVLSKNLNELVTKVNPDFVFFQAGVDVMKGDKLGKMNLTKEGVKQRDELVIESCKSYNIPIVITMGGGYSEKLKDLIEAHCNTFRVAVRLYS